MGIPLSEAALRLVDGKNYAVLATVNPDGSPQTSVVWVGRDGDDLLFSTVEGRVKHRNMLRDPRVSVTVIDSSDPENYVELRGRVSMTPDVGRRVDTQLSWKYDGKEPGEDRPGAVRVVVRMVVEKATGYAALARSRGPGFRYALGGLGCVCLKQSDVKRSWRPGNWPAGECRQPVDGGCVVADRLRIGESSGARLAGQLGSGERERPLGEIVGQLGRNAGGLDEVPPVREQVHDAPLQPLGAGGSAHRRRLASLQNPWAGRGSLQRRSGSAVRSGRIGAEPIGPTYGHRALLEQRHEHEVHPDEMIDDISHAPLRTRGRRRPLVGSYTVDQAARNCGCTCEIVENRRICHSARLRHDRPGAPLVFGR